MADMTILRACGEVARRAGGTGGRVTEVSRPTAPLPLRGASLQGGRG